MASALVVYGGCGSFGLGEHRASLAEVLALTVRRNAVLDRGYGMRRVSTGGPSTPGGTIAMAGGRGGKLSLKR